MERSMLTMKSIRYQKLIPTAEGMEIKKQNPIILTIGMEKLISFKNQDKEEKMVADYIWLTKSYYILEEETKQTAENGGWEIWKRAKKKKRRFWIE